MATSTTMERSASDYQHEFFEEKARQMREVEEVIAKSSLIPSELIAKEVAWFYNKLGIEDIFFKNEPAEKIAEFIMSVYAAKILSFTKHKTTVDITLEHQTDHGAIFLHNSQPGVSVGAGFEQKIDDEYLDNPNVLYRVETYRSKGVISEGTPVQLRCYFVEKCEFDESSTTNSHETDIQKIGSKSFLMNATENTLEVYQKIIKKAVNRTGPVIEHFSFPDTDEKRVVIAYRRGDAKKFVSSLSDLYHFYDLYSTRKFVEQFSNGMTVVSMYLMQLPESSKPAIDMCIYQLVKEISLLYILPTSPLQPLFHKKVLSVQETSYAYAAWKFAEHFLNRLGPEYLALRDILTIGGVETHNALLSKLKSRLRNDTFTSEYIGEVIQRYPELVRQLFGNFASVHHVSTKPAPGLTRSNRTISSERLTEYALVQETDLPTMIKRAVANPKEAAIFEVFLTFNKHILKTNFFQPTKVALSFRLNPAFLDKTEYAKPVFGMFFVVAAEFRGFHVRFADVARGGIRIIRSPNRDVFSRNLSSLFDENYNLANTQQRKNKDIPEGGSKGTVLLEESHQTPDKPELAFRKYVDGILDLLLVGQTPGVKDVLVDLYGKPEILFFGPDEGTADFMNWASQHAHLRAAPFWKAFTTGKSRSRGGIPHDYYGMTTLSIHQYVLGLLKKYNLKEEEQTKVQTGGPDGDLGSNEIKISKDKTTTIVDGSGVLYDPEGINRTELLRLATSRKMIKDYNLAGAPLSKLGYRVLVEEKNVKLPNGTIVENGMDFRNTFHLNTSVKADFFVPCGGRPEAVNIQNVSSLFDENGDSRFKFIVEGANLFFSQEARLALEKAGIPVFKDASTNKGGVTSSSFEVFASLALSDDEHAKNMCVADESNEPEFYKRYVEAVQRAIERNAALEFECLEREYAKSGVARSILSDKLSNKIVELAADLEQSTLWDNQQLRKVVLTEYCPKALLDLISLDTVIARVPEPYLKAIFGAYLASRFVYTHGLDYSPFAFFEFMQSFLTRAF
ncbi:NAD-specific glutamate dehydrogenase [Capsaspora owczarzaki ATCC 30864]|uniref:NAD-specific glutamate dehydrogenase n=1 Tax=Capsaspora owczarzaki (strain ATCC 30864) TaxID=595528 RepID=A0A0D2UJ06_CAPO3|nr:NAD-specific glutamate dehydrogenase [Capsaspora owczarzaki ATCC 30864]KJE95096.1 NAD-specific glutamate dehydrogenase [Capsaspora owczarzaki ATCC 30864]|eukprot:XP_004346259.1 NAD-specific glutamate dehydrogenase [Capsaspora owczarzaki ATCC 30864]